MRILHEHGCGSAQALGELSGKALGCLLVVGTDGKLLGTFTDGDLRRTLQSRGAKVPRSLLPCTPHFQSSFQQRRAVPGFGRLAAPPCGDSSPSAGSV